LLSKVPDGDAEKESSDDLSLPRALDFKHSLRPKTPGELIYQIIVVSQAIFSMALIWALLSKKAQHDCASDLSQVLFSPAQNVVEYQPKRFTYGFGNDTTIYQGEPSKEVDEAWEALYNDFGLSRIPKEQARLLPNKTLAIPGDEDHYAVALSVFHQIHCLNTVRKGLWQEHYTDPVAGTIAGIPEEEWPAHLTHCVDGIRQSLICSADISLIVWKWIESENQVMPRNDVVHSCRNFDKIAEWAKSHMWEIDFDLHMRVDDDIKIPII